MTLAVLVDRKDKYLLKRKWFLKGGYVFHSQRFGKVSKSIYLHHLIIGYPLNGNVVDHINGNKLDNRRSNLRIVSQRENIQNAVYRRQGLVGAARHGKSYQSQIKINGKYKFLGTFKTAEEASKAYWEALK